MSFDFVKFHRIMTTNGQNQKTDKRSQAKAEFAKLIENVCSRGFHGTAGIIVNLQDGHIQHTRVTVDRLIR